MEVRVKALGAHTLLHALLGLEIITPRNPLKYPHCKMTMIFFCRGGGYFYTLSSMYLLVLSLIANSTAPSAQIVQHRQSRSLPSNTTNPLHFLAMSKSG